MHRADCFADELTKLSFKLTPSLGATLTAAGIGGAWRGDKRYQEAKQQGKGNAVLEGLKGGLRGAVGGAALSGGLVAGSKLKGWVGNKSTSGVRGLHNLGGQQLHALTGYGGKGGAKAFGGGSAFSKKTMTDASTARGALKSKYKASGGTQTGSDMKDKWRKWRLSGADKSVAKTREGHKAMQTAEDMGLTSLPGTIGSVKKHGVRRSARAAWDAQMKGMGSGQKALLFGLPASFGVAGAVAAPKGQEGSAIGESAGMAASNVLPAAMSPSMMGAFSPAAHLMPTYLMSRPFMFAGKQIGKGVDWARSKVKGGGEQ